MKRLPQTKKTTIHRFRILLPGILLLFTFVFQTGCASSDTPSIQKSNFYFDTIITITLYGTTDESYIDQCFSIADRYEKLLSTTVSGSDVWNINSNAGSYVEVDPETLGLIRLGYYYGDLSNGKFDITVGPLSSLWNFSEISENSDSDSNEVDASVIPSEASIQSLLPHISYRNIQFNDNSVCLTDSEAQIDLGGIAKGYIADQMKQYLLSVGIHSGIINLGGNILTLGKKPDESPYRIGIQKPFSDSGEILGTLEINDQAVVTSGIYERYYRVDNTVYHHILDVTTGHPYDNGLASVTIICESSADADALSTTCFALGLQEGLSLIETLPDTEAIFVSTDNTITGSSGIGRQIIFRPTE